MLCLKLSEKHFSGLESNVLLTLSPVQGLVHWIDFIQQIADALEKVCNYVIVRAGLHLHSTRLRRLCSALYSERFTLCLPWVTGWRNSNALYRRRRVRSIGLFFGYLRLIDRALKASWDSWAYHSDLRPSVSWKHDGRIQSLKVVDSPFSNFNYPWNEFCEFLLEWLEFCVWQHFKGSLDLSTNLIFK